MDSLPSELIEILDAVLELRRVNKKFCNIMFKRFVVEHLITYPRQRESNMIISLQAVKRWHDVEVTRNLYGITETRRPFSIILYNCLKGYRIIYNKRIRVLKQYNTAGTLKDKYVFMDTLSLIRILTVRLVNFTDDKDFIARTIRNYAIRIEEERMEVETVDNELNIEYLHKTIKLNMKILGLGKFTSIEDYLTSLQEKL